MQALREWDKKRAFYPDANLTLRVAYGKVAGYEYADAEYHHPVSTIDGIMAKDDPNVYDYNIPQVLRDIYAAKDYGRWGQDIYGKLMLPELLREYADYRMLVYAIVLIVVMLVTNNPKIKPMMQKFWDEKIAPKLPKKNAKEGTANGK